MSAVPQTKQAHDYHVADLSLADWVRIPVRVGPPFWLMLSGYRKLRTV